MVFACAKVGVYQIGKMMAKCCQICKPSVFGHSCKIPGWGWCKAPNKPYKPQYPTKTKQNKTHKASQGNPHNTQCQRKFKKTNNAKLPKLPKICKNSKKYNGKFAN